MTSDQAGSTAARDAQSRVAVVTGAGGGLGAALAARLHAGGAKVAVADLNLAGAQQVADRLDASGATAMAVELDVREQSSFEALLAQVTGAWGPLSIVVNNAARTQITPLLEISAEEFRQVIDVNLTGTFLSCRVLGSHLAEQGYGRIVNMGSLAGQNGGTATGGHYAASKGGIRTLTKVFARDLASRGVTVNAVSPGPLDLPLVYQAVPAERMESYLAGIPVGRLGAPEFIADVVALLASDGASSVTGACWDVNGGLFMR